MSLLQPSCYQGPDDDLTNVTSHDIGGIAALGLQTGPRNEDSSQASNETYVLESGTVSCSERADKGALTNRSIMSEVAMKDAWAQVSKDLIHQRYEQEFLDMLLEEVSYTCTRAQGLILWLHGGTGRCTPRGEGQDAEEGRPAEGVLPIRLRLGAAAVCL